MEISKNTLRVAVHYLFTLVVLIMLVTGLGITNSQIVQPMTFGLLTKLLSFQLHNALVMPFVALLALHIYLVLTIRRDKNRKK